MDTTSSATHYHAPAVAERMKFTAEAFLSTLRPDQIETASFAMDDAERLDWYYTPVTRNGLLIKDMTKPQRAVAFDLMATGLGRSSNRTAHDIIELETTLGEVEAAEGGGHWTRDPELYWFSIFGRPGTDSSWSWRVGGHHLCLHYTVVNGGWIASTPLFFGANPAEIRHGPLTGTRMLPDEEDIARLLLGNLDESDLDTAIVDPTAPDDILTKNYRSIEPPTEDIGLAYFDLDSDNRKLVVRLIKHYVSRAAEDLAMDSWNRIEDAGLGSIRFAWAGPAEHGKPHYYCVRGPKFLIEYDNTQNGANHIHSVFREYENDFAVDLLRSHYEQTAHH